MQMWIGNYNNRRKCRSNIFFVERQWKVWPALPKNLNSLIFHWIIYVLEWKLADVKQPWMKRPFFLSRIFHRVATATRTLKALPISEAIMEELIISQIPLRINLNTPLNGTLSAILNFLLLCWKYPIQRRIVLSYLCIHISAKLVQGQWLIVPPCIKLRIIFGLWHARQKWKNVSARIWAIVLEMIFDRFYN